MSGQEGKVGNYLWASVHWMWPGSVDLSLASRPVCFFYNLPKTWHTKASWNNDTFWMFFLCNVFFLVTIYWCLFWQTLKCPPEPSGERNTKFYVPFLLQDRLYCLGSMRTWCLNSSNYHPDWPKTQIVGNSIDWSLNRIDSAIQCCVSGLIKEAFTTFDDILLLSCKCMTPFWWHICTFTVTAYHS